MSDETQSAAHDCFCRGAGPRFTQKVEEVRSRATAAHFRQAGVEFLKGVRSVLDLGIERLSKEPGIRGTSVTVE